MTKQQRQALAKILDGSIILHTEIATRVWNNLQAKGWARLVRRQRVATHNRHTGARLSKPVAWYIFEVEPTAAGCVAFNEATAS